MVTKNPQLDRFKEAARELETDDDEAKFNEKLGKLVKRRDLEKRPTDKGEDTAIDDTT